MIKKRMLGVVIALLTIIALIIVLLPRRQFTNYHKVAFFKTEEVLVVVDRTNIYQYNWQQKRRLNTLYTNSNNASIHLLPQKIAFSTNHQYLVFVEQRGRSIELALYNFVSEHTLHLPLLSAPKSLSFTDDDLFVEMKNGFLIRLDAKTGKIIEQTATNSKAPLPAISSLLAKHSDTIFDATFNTWATIQGNDLQVLSNDKLLWDHHFNNGKHGSLSLDFSPDGSKLLAGGAWSGQLGSIFIYDTSDGHLLTRVLGVNDLANYI